MLFLIIEITIISFVIVNKLFSDNFSKFVGNSFIIYWFGSLIISTFRPLGLYEISNKAYVLLILGGFAFILGMLFVGNRPYALSRTINKDTDFLLTNKIFLICLLLLTLYYLPHLKEAILYSQLQGKAARVNPDTDIHPDNKIFSSVYNQLGFLLFHLTNVVFWRGILYFKTKYTFPLVIVGSYILIFCLLNGGRVVVMILLMYLIFLFFYKHKFRIRIKPKDLILWGSGFLFALLLMSYITAYRKTGTYFIESADLKESLGETVERIVSYSTLPFVLFDRALTNDYFMELGAPYLGRVTFSGLDHALWLLLRNFINYEPTLNTIVAFFQENYFSVSTLKEANYAYTGLLYHYLDFGYIGIVFLPCLFGVLFRRLIHRVNKTDNIFLLSLSGLYYFMMLHAVFSCYLNKRWVIFYIIILLIRAKSTSKKVGQNQSLSKLRKTN